MKKPFFFLAPMGVLTGLLALLIVSCKSAPDADVWSLLRNGDDRASGYFRGEIDVNAVDPDGKTPLHYAAERGDARLAGFFISLGANVNALDNSGQSPLGISVEKNDTALTRLLATAGANIHLEIKGGTAAVLALGENPALFRALLTPASIETVDKNGKTVLHISSMAGNLQSVKDILELPSSSNSVNRRDNAEMNALDYALARPDSKSHMEIAEQLILSGAYSDNGIFAYLGPAAGSANYNIRRNEGLAPIHHAVMENYGGLLSFLLEKNIDPDIKSTSGATALHEAARNGNVPLINILLDYGANVNALDAKGNSPLHTGIPSNVHREVVTILLNKGANPNLRDEHGDTPLHIALILNRPLDVIQALLNGGSDVHIRNIDGKTPLYIAVQENRMSVIPVLLSYGSEIFAADNSGVTPFDMAISSNAGAFSLLVSPDAVNQRDSQGNTMLHAVIKNRGTAVQIGRILDNNAVVDARNRDGDTALHIAVKMNQRENGEFLISRGASIFSVNSAGESPLYAALNPSGGMREWIINSNTIIARDGLGNTMLHYAAQWNFNSAIPIIIRNGLSVEEPNATGETPLFMAVKANSPSTIRTLVENNANLNARDAQGNSALHTAVRWNAGNSATLLIASGVDINGYSLNGNTPLHEAVAYGMQDMETLLISRGANLEVRNFDGNTPYMEAVKAGMIPSIERLSRSGADTSTRNSRGDTPLHLAVAQERVDIVNTILRSGASIHARNTRNRTPFQISLGVSPRMVSALLEGDKINVPDDMGNSAIHIALQERASPEILRTIVNRGVRINAVDSNGKTPLRIAVDLELWPQVKILSDAGADPFLAAADNKTPAELSFAKGEECIRALFSGRTVNTRDNSGNTILHIAARYGTPEAINVLFELGANKTIRNIAYEAPADIAMRWNRSDNVEILR